MSDFDNRDEEEKKETGLEENKGKEPSDKKEEKTDKPEKEYEDVCFICRRPESKAGKMYHLPNNICVCDDCMHRTMDAVSQYDYQGMLNNPEMMNMLNNMNKDGKYPNISFVNLADLQGNDGIPNKQKIKKKKAKEQPFSMAKTPKKQGKKGKKIKQADDSLGFFARKAKKLAEKEANRQKSQKK